MIFELSLTGISKSSEVDFMSGFFPYIFKG